MRRAEPAPAGLRGSRPMRSLARRVTNLESMRML
jgi:hypothetical protein